MPPPTRLRARRAAVYLATATVVATALLLQPAIAGAAPIRVRYPEGPAHGYVLLSDLNGKALAHGELIQWLEKKVVASRLVFHFEDGSLYDEIVRFTQNPVFHIVSYHLIQRGPSFPETDVTFDQSGRYQVRLRPASDKDLEQASGKIDLPNDLSNGMTSTYLKNLKPGESAKTHLIAFTPKPNVLELEMTPHGTDDYWLGRDKQSAHRFVVTPRVTGLKGAVATVLDKQPDPLRYWIAAGKAPALLKFEGVLYGGGPEWRVELSAPRWSP